MTFFLALWKENESNINGLQGVANDSLVKHKRNDWNSKVVSKMSLKFC